MSIDPVSAYGEPFPEGFETWHPDDQHNWKQEKARNVLLGNQTQAFTNLAGAVGAGIRLPDPAPTFPQRRAMGDMTTVHPTASTTPIQPHVADALSEFGLSGFRTVGDALKHIRNTAQYFGFPVGQTSRITSEGTTTNEATRFLAQEADRSAESQRIFTGEEARLFDEAHTLHDLMSKMMIHGRTPMTSITDSLVSDSLADRLKNKKTRPTIDNESLDVTPTMDKERAARAAGEPIPPSEKTVKAEKEFDKRSAERAVQSTPKTPKSVEIKHLPGIVYDPAIHTPELHRELIRLQLASQLQYDPAVHTPKKYMKLANAHIKAKEAEKQSKISSQASTPQVYPPAMKEIEVNLPVKPEMSPEEKQANLAYLETRKANQAELANFNMTRQERYKLVADKNTRLDVGQRLGIKLPDGRVVPLEDRHRPNVIISRNINNPLETHNRILDHTPMTHYPIVEL
jgi:hypothetical protein